MDENKDNRAWYKKKRYIIPLSFLGLLLVLGLSNQSSTIQPAALSNFNQTQSVDPINNTASPSVKPIVNPIVLPTPATTNDNTGLSNDNHYVNVNGNTVHSPAFSNSVPAGASAKCRDGTYSFSQNRRGTCSHHGGVAQWY